MAREGINWIALRTAYVVQGYSAQKCADVFGVDPTTIRKRASKEGWTSERHRNRTDATGVALDAARAVVSKISAGHVEAAARQVGLANKMAEKLAEAIDLANAKDPKILRSLIEAGARLAEWTDRSVMSERIARGLKPGDASSEPAAEDREFTIVRNVVNRPPDAIEQSA